MKNEKLLFLCLAAAGACVDVAASDPYVAFTGAQSVDTGYRVTKDTAVVADFARRSATAARRRSPSCRRAASSTA